MAGDWYARQMYIEGHAQYNHHLRVYGHPSKHGYREIPPLWKAENFDPDRLMQLFVDAGAKYFVGQAMHHDNFDCFDSTHQKWNSVNIGPKKDIVGLWRNAAQAHGLPFGVSEHLGAAFEWFETNKGADKSGQYAGVPYDGNDPEYADLYFNNKGNPIRTDVEWFTYTDNAEFQTHWFDRIKDVIDRYKPDLLYTDGGVPFGRTGLSIVAHLYNTSAALHGKNRAIYTQKYHDPQVYRVGVLDIERGQASSIAEHPWQTDTCVGNWYYDIMHAYKTPTQILETLVDVVSKNGNLSLNIPLRPDGTIDDECDYLLRQMAVWMKTQSEGIFGSRPWTIAGEGESQAAAGAFKETAVEWTPRDFRFTTKADVLYAYQMRPPTDGTAMIKSLALGKARRIASVSLLGDGKVDFQQTADGLLITIPTNLVQDAPQGLAIVQE
jgi:alpha-L-fucosidase